MPDIMDLSGNLHTQNIDKVKAMAGHFFPSPVYAELEDIKGAIYPEIHEPISNYVMISLRNKCFCYKHRVMERI